nr:ATP-binding protein [Candidatus Sulfurimonas ponti]
FNIKESVDEALQILEQLLKQEMVLVIREFEDVEVLGVSNELTQVIINLLKNSIDAFVLNSVLIREISIKIRVDFDAAIIEVKDNAGGIKEKSIYKIFEPYFTTKHTSQGTGLGLFMSKMICEQGLSGSLDVNSKKGTTTFRIKIPLEKNHAQ